MPERVLTNFLSGWQWSSPKLTILLFFTSNFSFALQDLVEHFHLDCVSRKKVYPPTAIRSLPLIDFIMLNSMSES